MRTAEQTEFETIHLESTSVLNCLLGNRNETKRTHRKASLSVTWLVAS